MNRLKQFIFDAVNTIASKRLEASAEYLLAEAVRAELANARRESRSPAALAGRRG